MLYPNHGFSIQALYTPVVCEDGQVVKKCFFFQWLSYHSTALVIHAFWWFSFCLVAFCINSPPIQFSTQFHMTFIPYHSTETAFTKFINDLSVYLNLFPFSSHPTWHLISGYCWTIYSPWNSYTHWPPVFFLSLWPSYLMEVLSSFLNGLFLFSSHSPILLSPFFCNKYW